MDLNISSNIVGSIKCIDPLFNSFDGGQPHHEGRPSWSPKMALLFVLVLITTTGLRYLFTILTNTLGQNVIKDIRNKVFAHLLGMKLAYFDKTPVGTNTTRTVNDLESVNVVFAEGLITIMADVLGLLTILGMMFYTSVKLTFISLVSFPLLLIASYIFKEK